MILNPLNLMGSWYADNSLTWSAQRTLNWLPETAEVEGTRTPIKFADVPGLRAVVDLGTGAPVRGLENVEGKLFAVSGTSLFDIGLDYSATNRGNIPGVSRVSMAHNKQGGTTAANQLAIANGLSGYVYNTSTNVLAQITGESFEGATTVDYIDGYITFTDPQGRFWGHSALNQAGEHSTIDRYDAESAPDPIISQIASHREEIIFGTRTTEFFRNTGAATNTFQRVDGTELEVGICAPFARARVDNSVCWVSDSLEVFRLEGHSPQRISTRPIEQLLHTVNPANIFAFSWEDRGHKVFYITAPEAFTLGFDFASGMWHERQTFGLPRWRVNALASWNGQWIAGDYTNGLLYVLDWDTHHENGLELIRERASGYTHGGQNKVLAPYVELLFDTGTPGIDSLTLSGDLPNANTGDVVSYQYSSSGGASPRIFSISSGSLPPGLSISTSGLVTGTHSGGSQSGTLYSWTVLVTDVLGNTATLPDSAIVTSLFSTRWALVNTADSTNLWLSNDAITWDGPYARSQAMGVNGYGASTSGKLTLASSTSTVSVLADSNPIDGITTTLVDTSNSGARIYSISGILFKSHQNDAGTEFFYAVSQDGGLSWTEHACPGTTFMRGITRLNSGRWIAHFNRGPTQDAYYSDQSVPTSWTYAFSFPGTVNYEVASDGATAIVIGTSSNVHRTTDGSTWTTISTYPVVSPVDLPGFVMRGVGGVFIGQSSSDSNICRSIDGGATWTTVSTGVTLSRLLRFIDFANGRWVACMQSATDQGRVVVSLDSGASWAPATMPYVTISDPLALFIE